MLLFSRELSLSIPNNDTTSLTPTLMGLKEWMICALDYVSIVSVSTMLLCFIFEDDSLIVSSFIVVVSTLFCAWARLKHKVVVLSIQIVVGATVSIIARRKKWCRVLVTIMGWNLLLVSSKTFIAYSVID